MMGGGGGGGGPTYGGGTVTLDIASRMLTVSSTPEAIDAVDKYIRKVRHDATRNIIIGLKVYKLTIDSAKLAGFSTSAFLNQISHGLGVTSSGITLPSDQNGLSQSMSLILPPSTMSGGSVAQGATQVALEAMQDYGTVSVVTSGTLLTTNGVPVPFQDAEQISYLMESGSTLAANVGSQQMNMPGQLTVGFTSDFIPEIMSNDRIMVQFQIQISALKSMGTSPGNPNSGNVIQLPNVDYQTLDQSAVMKNGSTLVLAGYEKLDNQYQSQGGASGASVAGTKTRDVTVILLTATRFNVD